MKWASTIPSGGGGSSAIWHLHVSVRRRCDDRDSAPVVACPSKQQVIHRYHTQGTDPYSQQTCAPSRSHLRRRRRGGHLVRSDIVPGGTFPDYALPDHTGTVRTLSELQGRDPLILTLARGNYCPKEHRQHLELAENYAKIAVAYTQLATIATDDHHTLQEFRASVGAQWPFLSDPERTVQKDLEIQEYTDPANDPMIPHTLVLKPGLVVHSIYNGYWFWGRPSVVDLWHDLREVSREIRPDWDLSAPGVREAWEAKDLSPFHGWNRRGTGSRTA